MNKNKQFNPKYDKECLKKSLGDFELFKFYVDRNCPYDLETVNYIYIDNKATSHLDQNQVELSRKYFEDFIKRSTDLDPKIKSEIEKDIEISNACKFMFDENGECDACIIC
tara:strand:+ start:110 stop:442 length:333 start_codon:yes stop_codon:yes gene_type:complete